MEKGGDIQTKQSVKKVIIKNSKVTGVIVSDSLTSEKFIPTNSVVISYPAYTALNQLFEENVIDRKFVQKIDKLNKTTSVVEVHFALNSQIDTRQGCISCR